MPRYPRPRAVPSTLIDPFTGLVDQAYTRVSSGELQAFLDAPRFLPLRFRVDPDLDVDGWARWRLDGDWLKGLVAFQRHINHHCYLREDVRST